MISIAQYGLLVILSLSLLFHFFILLKIIPYHFVWGGRLKSNRAMIRFEMVSILLNALFLTIVLIQARFLAINIPAAIITYALWIMTGLFVLNTLGNAVSKNKHEQKIFTPLTLLLAAFSWVLALAN